jgi:hypothetical protein
MPGSKIRYRSRRLRGISVAGDAFSPWCATSGRAGNPPPGPGSPARAPDELVTALYLPVLRVASSTEIIARIHSRARSSSFARSSGVSACPASLTQSRANSSNSFADSDDMGCSHNFRLSTLIMRFVVPGSITREAGTANCTYR